VSGVFHTGEQFHMFMEPHVAIAIPEEGFVKVFAPVQNPSDLKREIAICLGIKSNK